MMMYLVAHFDCEIDVTAWVGHCRGDQSIGGFLFVFRVRWSNRMRVEKDVEEECFRFCFPTVKSISG